MNTREDNIAWLSQFYSKEQLKQLSTDQIKILYQNSQPQTVCIKNLENIPVDGYKVDSPDGYVSAHLWRNKGIKPCVKLSTATRDVNASVDHFFEMADGKWKYAEYILPGEMIKTEFGIEAVTSVVPIGDHEVFDFHIDHENHRYYTNGFSSHNSGAGKSLFLANLGVNYALSGLNVIYLTLELSEELVSMRIDSMITGISTREVFKQIDDVEMKVKVIGKKAGTLQVKYMPSGKTANDVRAYLKEFEVKTGRKCDVLLVDYLDLLMPAGQKISAENLFIKDKYVSEELRNLAMEKNCVFVTAAQLNRCLDTNTLVEVNGMHIPIRDVKVGDYVTSNTGPVQVTKVYPIVKQSVVKIKTKTGKEIVCSAKHKFPTSNGLQSIESGLTVGDKLQILRSSDK